MKNKIIHSIVTAVSLLFFSNAIFAQSPDLGAAATFVLFSTNGAVSNTGPSHLTGNVGTNNGAISGFGNVNGVMHNSDGATATAAGDLLKAYNKLDTTKPTFFHAPLLGNGDTLVAGVYSISGNTSLNLNLVLNAKGNANAVFIFQIGGTLSTNTFSKIILVNGALACNVFWKVEGLVSMATATEMKGNVIANNAAINMNTGVMLEGRALSTTGAVSLNGVSAHTPVGCGSPLLTGPAPPALASTTCYAIFSASGGVSNGGVTYISGDVGTNVGLTAGYDSLNVNGTIHLIPDPSTANCAADLGKLYNYLDTLHNDIQLLFPAQFGNGLVLTPHTYLMNGAAVLTDTLFLDAEGNADAVFVIKVNGGALSTSTYATVKLLNGAKAGNVFWKVEGAVAINDYSTFKGTIVCNNGAVDLKTGVALEGRAFTTTGALSTAAINVTIPPGCSSLPKNIWTGALNTNWFTIDNWTGVVPDAGKNAVIANVPNQPLLTADASCLNLTLNNAASLTTGANSLNVYGNIINSGIINGTLGTIALPGSTLQKVTGSFTVKNFVLNNPAGASIDSISGSTVNVLNTYMPVNGTLNTGDNLVLISSAAGTARVAALGAGASVIGKVTAERYFPARRAWRLITAPAGNANTIKAAWQNNGVYTTGTGTFITGLGGGNGLDTGNNYSLKTYDVASQLLLPVTNSNVSLSAASGSSDNKGYFLFVRGDRNPANLTPPNTNITTISSTGRLQTGTQTFSASGVANNFTLIGNPYPSPVNFEAATRNNLAKRFYAWDPALNTVGGYVLLDDIDQDGIYSVVPASTQTNILQSGQAVFVQTINASSASLTFEESSKSDISTSAGFRTNNGTSEVFRTNLYLKNTDNTTTLADGVQTEYNSNFSAAVNIEDGVKMENINENLAIAKAGTLLALERRPLIDANDTLFLKLSSTSVRNYQFEFIPSNFSNVVSASLRDTYLNTSTPVSTTALTHVDFSVTANTASAAADRFRVEFKTNGTLPISNIVVKAYQQNAGIAVEWNLATESDISHYEVEKSGDGQTFTKMSTATATGNNNAAASYTWFDPHTFSGDNFYRIKALAKTGEIKYSQVADVKTGNGKSDITVYPNPVQDKTLNIQLINQPKGTYIVELLNALGQQLLTKKIEHAGGSATQTIQLNSLVAKGVYQLHVSNGDNKINQQVIVE